MKANKYIEPKSKIVLMQTSHHYLLDVSGGGAGIDFAPGRFSDELTDEDILDLLNFL